MLRFLRGALYESDIRQGFRVGCGCCCIDGVAWRVREGIRLQCAGVRVRPFCDRARVVDCSVLARVEASVALFLGVRFFRCGDFSVHSLVLFGDPLHVDGSGGVVALHRSGVCFGGRGRAGSPLAFAA